ncbi:ring-infected erythrocyte surface antigen [Pieris rapae]|uniref:ring-infected erythrocyte surface antigen n=1 Tax=Pieris rapae TaxID=64459 RepID=UPI001E27E98B|nr:ring-infected erythrocyte surface antigen [Pieris rapae]
MKVLALLCLALGSVSARGSGPYLPSGWRPDGPAFYLPTKQASTDPLKDLILHGSEASGSDSLREYGPPKFSQEVIKQDLPSENIDLTFTSAEKLQQETLNGSEPSGIDASSEIEPPKIQESKDLIATELPAEVTEQVFVEKSNDVPEAFTIKAQEEPVTELQFIETTTILAEVPILIIQDNSESALTASSLENEDVSVSETPLPVEITTTSDVKNSVEADVASTDDSTTNETKDNLVEPTESLNSLTAVKVELEQTVQQIVQNYEKSIEKVSENIVKNIEKIEESGLKIEKSEQNVEEKQVEQNVQNFSENTQNAEHFEQANEKTEENEQKTLEQVVQNIPEVLTYVNNDKTQVEKTQSQNEESSYPEFSGSLEQAPEGFLEYGPPGFKEYGPPKEDELARSTSEELISEAESFESTNETRRRRFSPKFKPTKNH